MLDLSNIGLTEKSFELYTLLLKLGEVPVLTLIKESGYKRATIYKTLYSLENVGMVTKKDINKVIHFKPEPPQKLLEITERRYSDMNRVLKDIQGIIPELNSHYILSIEKPLVSTFEGVEGIKKIYEDTLKDKQSIFAVLQTSEVEPELFNWLNKVYTKKRKELGINADVILSSGYWSKGYIDQINKNDLGSTRLVPEKEFPFKLEINIYGNKVAFINYKKGGALIGIIINNPLIATTMKAMFDLAWIAAKN